MMISCKKASELTSKNLDEELSLGEKARMWLHVGMCAFCNQFRRQIAFISRLFKNDKYLEECGPGMRPEDKEKLHDIVRKCCKD